MKFPHNVRRESLMPIKLFIVRHGQPLDLEIKQKVRNAPLGSMGRKQAELAAAEMQKFGGIDVLYSSSLRRALDTAKAFYEEYNIPWHVWPSLCETGRRDWPHLRELQAKGEKLIWEKRKLEDSEGLFTWDSEHPREDFPLLSELTELYPDIQFTQPFEWPDAWWLPLREETRELAYRRAELVIQAIRERHGGQDCNIVLACHGAFGSVLMTVLTEGPPCDHNRFSFAHASFSCVQLLEDSTTQVLLSNYINHLYPDYLTPF